ncbi:MAG: Tex family protein, partial [Granulosicoccaceae bacterium]
LDGARQIIMERAAEQAGLVSKLRERLWEQGVISSELVAGKAEEGAKFSDYFEFSERVNKVPSHRALAMFRGRDAGILSLKLDLPVEDPAAQHPAEQSIAAELGIRDQGRPADKWLRDTVRWSWRVKLHTRLDLDLKTRLREQAEEEAIAVFSRNIKDVLMAAPAGPRATMGLDPGIRTGVKVAVVDQTGKVLDTATIYPHPPKRAWDQSLAVLAELCKRHQVELIAIGNGTASRETDKLAAELMAKTSGQAINKVMVNEAGASVYSASALAAAEFPDMDVSLRGAVSIARRLQDPLAELVKVEPKAIGVGQYQHDVNQTRLARALDGVVEDCVNGVGVDLNMASAPLLSRVSGLNKTLAKNVVDWRDANGAFNNRKQLLDVPRLGPVAYEQCAGFLRVREGDNPLDASGVHPEAYGVAERIVGKFGGAVDDLIGNAGFLGKLRVEEFVDETFGAPTVADIIEELHKPGRDPRPAFETAEFREGVETLNDLSKGMKLQGVVTNVTNFGAFVDIGVHQDGLVHISALADRYVKDPHEVVKAGDVVKVTVMEIDIKRRRVGLSMRSDANPDAASERGAPAAADKRSAARPKSSRRAPQPSTSDNGNSAMADALRAALKS